MRKLPIVMLMLTVLATAARSDAQAVTGTPPPNRTALEQRLRERIAQITRNRLGLDDAKMAQLEVVNSRFVPEMNSLAAQERDTRQQLRRQMTSAAPDQSDVARLLDNLFRLQRQRIALLESEQKELAMFLTPVQRAQYMGLQAQIRRRADQLRRPNAARFGGRARDRLPR